jgi:hypothetical protein
VRVKSARSLCIALRICCLALAEAGASEEGNANVVDLMLGMWRLR